MKRAILVVALAASLATAIAGASQAAPIAPVPQAAATDRADVIKAYYYHGYYHRPYYHPWHGPWRHCYWRYGYRHCW